MAVSILTSSSHVQSLFDTSITQSINTGTTGSDRVLVIGLSFDSDGSGGKADNAQYNTDAMTFIARILPVNGTNGGVELWYLVNPDTGANNFTADFINDTTGNPQEVAGVHIQHWTLQDAAQTGQPDVSDTDSGTDAARSAAFTTTEPDTMLLGIAAGLKGGTFASWAPQGGATEDSDTSTPNFTISTGLHRAQATAAATSLATTMNSANATSVMVAAAFKSVATPIALDGTGATETDGAGSLSVDRMLDGAGASETDGSGQLRTTRALAGVGATASDGAGALSVKRSMSGTGASASDGSSRLALLRQLQATGSTITNGFGLLNADLPIPSIILEGSADETIALKAAASELVNLKGSGSELVNLEGSGSESINLEGGAT